MRTPFVNIFSPVFSRSHSHTLTPTFRQLNQTAKVFPRLKLLHHHPTSVVEKSYIFYHLLPFFCKVGNVEKFQFGHERLVMPAAKADWFTEGSKVVRQGRFRHSSGRLRHDGDNPLSRDSGQWCSSIVIIIQLKYAIFQQLSLTNLQQKYII